MGSGLLLVATSQSAFVRGFIDDSGVPARTAGAKPCLNPRSCAASSMTQQCLLTKLADFRVSIRVRARLHR